MKVWVYVEGESDTKALNKLWEDWKQRLRESRWGLDTIALGGKNEIFKKIGPRAAEKLTDNTYDIVIALPDLYPNRPFQSSKYNHNDVTDLGNVLRNEVSEALKKIYKVGDSRIGDLLNRFLPSALKYDLEMLLLAARDELRNYLETQDRLKNWREPVEDQNQDHPPKVIVNELFRTKSRKKRSYRSTVDAASILGRISNIKEIIFDSKNHVQCPVFKQMLDWIGDKTGVPAYESDA